MQEVPSVVDLAVLFRTKAKTMYGYAIDPRILRRVKKIERTGLASIEELGFMLKFVRSGVPNHGRRARQM